MKHLFFCEEITGDFIQLDEEESTHAIRVLRLKPDDVVFVTDGKGKLAECKVTETGKKTVTLQIITTTHKNPPLPRFHLLIAPTKNMDRMEWMVEKLTEIGITKLTPVVSRFSERKVIKTDRLKKIALNAVKQSQQCWLPVIHELTDVKTCITREYEAGTIKLIAHCKKGELPHITKGISATNTNYAVLIGPEGDFADEEIELAKNHGWKEISLGENRLRTETAGLLVGAIIHIGAVQ